MGCARTKSDPVERSQSGWCERGRFKFCRNARQMSSIIMGARLHRMRMGSKRSGLVGLSSNLHFGHAELILRQTMDIFNYIYDCCFGAHCSLLRIKWCCIRCWPFALFFGANEPRSLLRWAFDNIRHRWRQEMGYRIAKLYTMWLGAHEKLCINVCIAPTTRDM